MALSFIFGGDTGETPESIKRKRDLAMAIMGASTAPRNVGEGLNALGSGIVAGAMNRRANKAEKAGRGTADALFNRIIGQAPDVSASNMLSPGIKPASTSTSAGTGAAASVNVDPSIRDGIVQTASALGVDPVDLATAISYETAGTFDPTKAGPTTKWGKHRGLIQFGEPQAQQYGVNWDDPVGSQLGENGAVAKYLRSTGVKPGMGLLDIYSAINSGGVGRYNASDAAAGGAPGTVRDKVEEQMAGHRAKALALFGDQGQEVASLDPAIGMPPQTAAGAVNALAAGGGAPPPSLSEEVAAFEQTPEYRAQFPGMTGAPQTATPPAQGAPQGIPPQFQGSQQLANAQGGIMPALMGGSPASPEQVAQAQAMGQQQPPPQQAPAQGGPDQMEILKALSNPWLSQEQKAVLQTLYDQQVQQSDPVRQMQLEKGRIELDQMRNPQPEYEVLTPEERRSLGIPDTDQRVYQRARGGKIDAVGGAGQTINVGNEIEARQTAAAELGLSPDDPRYQPFVLTGKFPREDAQELTATDKKAMWAAEDELPLLDNTLSALEQARDLNRKTFTGTGAGILGTIGTNVPGAGLLIDSDKAKATSEFNKLMSMEAIQSMAQTLKGATTDSELARFVDILADPSTDPDIRERTIDRMISLARRIKEVKSTRINELRGGGASSPSPGGKKTTNIGGYTIEEE